MTKAVGSVSLGLIVALVLASSASAATAFQCDNTLDNFNRADSATLGPSWTEQSPSIGIQNDQATNPNSSDGLATFNGASSREACIDVYDNGTGTQYAALVLGYADPTDNVFVKVQNNGPGGADFNTVWFYYGNNGACQVTSGCEFSVTPFSAARLDLVVTANVVRLDIDPFDNAAEQTLTATYNAPFNLGSGIGIGDFGGTSVDNFSIPARPSIGSISPDSGSVLGGDFIELDGHALTGATVTFNGVPGRITGGYDDQLLVYTPKTNTVNPDECNPKLSCVLGPVDVRVTTPYGISDSTYTYTGCRVPKLKGKTLRKARKALKKAGCVLQSHKGKKHGRVKRQNIKPGTVLGPLDNGVNVTLR